MTTIDLHKYLYNCETKFARCKPGDIVALGGEQDDCEVLWNGVISGREDGALYCEVPHFKKSSRRHIATVSLNPHSIGGEPMSQMKQATVGRTAAIHYVYTDGSGVKFEGPIVVLTASVVQVGRHRATHGMRHPEYRITQTGGI